MIFRHLLNMRSHPTWVRGLKHVCRQCAVRSKRGSMKKLDGFILLTFGLILALATIDFIIGPHFGIQYCFLLIAAVLIICGL